MSLPGLDELRRRLAVRAPELLPSAGMLRAAVALILHDPGTGLELLFIERARHERDPWSGHMAFPGGRVDVTDSGERAAAERETFEEVGVSLASAPYLGRLDDLQGHPSGFARGMVVSAHLYHVSSPAPLAPNEEVETAFWFPLRDLLDPDRRTELRPPGAKGQGFPAICVGDPERHIVWGLTYRFLQSFLQRVGLDSADVRRAPECS